MSTCAASPPLNKVELLSEIEYLFKDFPNRAKAAAAIVNLAYDSPEGTRFSLSDFSLNAPFATNTEVIQTLPYLMGAAAQLLHFVFEFTDPEGKAFILEKQSVKHLIETGELLHPVSGENVKDPEKNVFIFYARSKK